MALATNTTPGEIVLAGDLNGTAHSPSLRVINDLNPGTYTIPTLFIDIKGRITHATNTFATKTTKGIVQIGNNINVSNGIISILDATNTTKGVVQIGNNINISDGIISIPDATNTTKGVVRVGNNINVSNGIISIPDATKTSKGVVRVGNNIDISNGIISVPDATKTSKGVVRVGNNIDISNGVISIPDATNSSKGVVRVGNNINISNGIISIPDATKTSKGVVRVGNNIDISNGIISVPDATDLNKGVVKSANPNYITISAGNIDVGSNVVKTDVNNVFTKAQYSNIVNLIDSPTITVDAALGNIFNVVLQGNRTLANPINLAPGSYTFIIKQNNVGGHTLSYGSAYKFKNGFSNSISTTPNSTSLLVCISDGTNLFCSVGKEFA